MGIEIRALDESEPAPRRIVMVLTCDGPHPLGGHLPLIPRAVQVFPGRHPQSDALAAGWLFCRNGRVKGPCCHWAARPLGTAQSVRFSPRTLPLIRNTA